MPENQNGTVQAGSEIGTGATVRGRVVDVSGNGIEGAWVGALAAEDARLTSAISATDGSFECRRLQPDRVILYVGAPGMKHVDLNLGVLRNGEIREGVEIRLEPRPPITGHVQWPNGDAAAGCVVLYSPEQDSDMGFSDEPVTCDGLGGFRIVAPTDGKPMALTAYWPADLEVPAVVSKSVFSWVAHRDDVEQGTSGLILSLVPSSKLQITILDESDAALDRCSVYALPFCREHVFQNHEFRGRGILDDASGDFVIQGLHGGRWLLVAEATDHVRSESWVDLPGDAGHLTITLRRTVQLAGVVVDPTGAPSPNAAIFLVVRVTDRRSGEEVERVELGGSTDEHGRFVVGQVPTGPVIVEAYSEDRTLRGRSKVDVESARPPPEMTLVLRTRDATPEMDRPLGGTRR